MKRAVIAAAALAMAAAGVAAAADAAPAVKQRQQGMKAVGAATKGLNDALNRGAPAAELKTYADRLAQLSAQSGGWFPAGSGPGAGVKTAALPAIWTRPAQFQAGQAAFAAQGAKLKAAAASGDKGAVKAEFGALRRSCKGCHDGFRAED